MYPLWTTSFPQHNFLDALISLLSHSHTNPHHKYSHALVSCCLALAPRYWSDRTFDVGIAEQHAVTFAAGLAVEGLKPMCTIYSTFLQRGFDQVNTPSSREGRMIFSRTETVCVVEPSGHTKKQRKKIKLTQYRIIITSCCAYSFSPQVVHDVALQKLPVRFAMDRAGLVGEDGPTHAGAYDVTFMACLPDMVVMAPMNEAELCHMVRTHA